MDMNNMNTKTGAYFYNDESCDFKFVTDLPAVGKLKFVNSVTDLIVDETRYNSIIRDIIFDFYLIDIMTDIDVSEFKKSPNFLKDVEEFLLSTNIVAIVKANAAPTLIDELNTAVDKSIQYLTGIHPSPLSEALASLVSTLEKKINEVDITSMTEMAQKFAGITGEFTLDNVVNAYMNSDIHKKNLVEIAEAKKQRAEFAQDMDKAIKLVKEESKHNNK